MDVAGQKVAVIGMGRTALALARLLLREGARPFLTELTDSQKLGPHKQELADLGVPFEVGGHTDRAIDGASLVISSPGVSPEAPIVRRALERGARLMGELEFAYHYCPSPIIAVTGTNGKTTTTELLRALITGAGYSVALAGNNATPFSAAVMLSPAPEFFVLEVSSYQLELIESFRPWIGAVLNLSTDHLARHKTIDAYAAAKARIFINQQQGDHAVLNADDTRTNVMALDGPQRRWLFSATRPIEHGLWVDGPTIRCGDAVLARIDDIRIPGRHNLENVLAALTVLCAGKFPWDPIRSNLPRFPGVEHRIERIAVLNHVTYINDSKSTNLDSLKVALESFDQPIVLIAGGQGKGGDYRTLLPLIEKHVVHIVTLGEDAPRIEAAYAERVPCRRAADMDHAVRAAAALARPGDIVLLSPACASFDMFDDFEHRGRVFKACVAKLADQAGLPCGRAAAGG